VWSDIIIFAVIALFLGLKLRSVLGQQHDVDVDQAAPPPASLPSKPPLLRSVDSVDNDDEPTSVPQTAEPKPSPLAPAPDSLAGRIHRVQQADANFNEKKFIAGARGAFEMIVAAFAAGDTAQLRPLLTDDVYDNFATAIRNRQSNGQKLTTRIIKFTDIDLVDAEMVMNTARVTVRFVTEQMQSLTNTDGTPAEGSNSAPQEVIDLWVFSRNTRSLDPNWQLAETRSDD